MSEHTAIEWCDSTFNPWIGCTRVSPGCDHCYAEALMDKRWGKVHWGAGQPRVRTSPANWRQPLLWEREHQAFALMHGRRRRVFCASLADVFDNEVAPAWRADLFALIGRTPNLDWLLLTKRIGNAHEMIGEALIDLGTRPGGGGPTSLLPSWPWPNVWIGATIVNQPEYDRDIGKLLRLDCPNFLSLEPLLGAIDLRLGGASLPTYLPHRPLRKLDWVIAGGESGHGARPAHPDWFRSLAHQCRVAGVPFFMKQLGGHPNKQAEVAGFPVELRIQEWPHAS